MVLNKTLQLDFRFDFELNYMDIGHGIELLTYLSSDWTMNLILDWTIDLIYVFFSVDNVILFVLFDFHKNYERKNVQCKILQFFFPFLAASFSQLFFRKTIFLVYIEVLSCHYLLLNDNCHSSLLLFLELFISLTSVGAIHSHSYREQSLFHGNKRFKKKVRTRTDTALSLFFYNQAFFKFMPGICRWLQRSHSYCFYSLLCPNLMNLSRGLSLPKTGFNWAPV